MQTRAGRTCSWKEPRSEPKKRMQKSLKPDRWGSTFLKAKPPLMNVKPRALPLTARSRALRAVY